MSTSFQEMIQKVINAKAKADLKPSAIVWELDACYSKGHCLFYNTFSKIQTQYLTTKKSKPEKYKPKKSKTDNKKSFALSCPDKPAKQIYQEKKKKY